jgi:hypothetical protein
MAISAPFTAARSTPDFASVLTRVGCEANSGPGVDGEIGAEVSGRLGLSLKSVGRS